MRRISKEPLNQQSKSYMLFFLILFTILINSLNTSTPLFPTNILSSSTSQLSKEERTLQTGQKYLPDLKITKLANIGEPIQYYLEQNVQFDIKTSSIKQMVTSSSTNVSIESKAINSSFQIQSDAENCSNDWQNTYGVVDVSSIFSEGKNVTRLNFSVSDTSPIIELTNTKYSQLLNPDVTSFPTFVSFDFRVPFLDEELLSTKHSLEFEMIFNKSSIMFILSDFNNSDYGEYLEENVFQPDDGTDRFNIFCNETAPFGWKNVAYNITRLITTYVSQENYSKFAGLEELTCRMISNPLGSEYLNLSLDIDNLEYLTLLPPSVPINYSIGEIMISSNDSSLNFSSTMGNFTFVAYEESPWVNNSKTFLEVNITREKVLESFFVIEEWNDTLIRIMSNITIPDIIENPSTNFIHMMFPSDWINFSILIGFS